MPAAGFLISSSFLLPFADFQNELEEAKREVEGACPRVERNLCSSSPCTTGSLLDCSFSAFCFLSFELRDGPYLVVVLSHDYLQVQCQLPFRSVLLYMLSGEVLCRPGRARRENLIRKQEALSTCTCDFNFSINPRRHFLPVM